LTLGQRASTSVAGGESESGAVGAGDADDNRRARSAPADPAPLDRPIIGDTLAWTRPVLTRFAIGLGVSVEQEPMRPGCDAYYPARSRTTAAGFPEGAAIKTDRRLYFGFGLEGVTGAANRAMLMGRAMVCLLR
jgi:hypothetical protein